jgi:hypothetical protein
VEVTFYPNRVVSANQYGRWIEVLITTQENFTLGFGRFRVRMIGDGFSLQRWDRR